MKPAPGHIAFLDYFRGVAILSVFFFHALWPAFKMFEPDWTGWFRNLNIGTSYLLVLPAAFGRSGVPIFFAVSGFCIHLSHQRSRDPGLKVFFIRRFFRIYPPYLLALCLACLFNVGAHLSTRFDELVQFVLHLFLVHNFDDPYFYGVNRSLWSIAVEVQLYLLYPVVLWLATRLGWQRALLVTAITELGLRTFESFLTASIRWEPPRFYTGSPLYYWFSWTMGAALAEAYLKGEALPFRNALGFVWPVLFVGAWFFRPLFPYTFTLAALSTTSLMAYGLSRPSLGLTFKGWGSRALEHLRWAGIVSYSAYLIHQPILNEVPAMLRLIFHHTVFPHLVMYGICLCFWFPIFGLSCLFYRWVEQPSIAWGKRVIDRNRKTGLIQTAALKPTSPS